MVQGWNGLIKCVALPIDIAPRLASTFAAVYSVGWRSHLQTKHFSAKPVGQPPFISSCDRVDDTVTLWQERPETYATRDAHSPYCSLSHSARERGDGESRD